MANELQLAAGLKLTNPAPADAYYCLPQVGQAPAQPYESPAQACSYVPQALRYQGLTVNVAGVGEMSWSTADLSNDGLFPKAGGSPATGVAGFEVRAYSPSQVVISIPKGLPRTQATIDNLLRMALVPKAPEPTSYDTTLTSASPTADGVNFLPASTQELDINERPGATGGTLSFSLVDSSDGSTSSADVLSSYVGDYFRFKRADGVRVKATWGSTSQTITL